MTGSWKSVAGRWIPPVIGLVWLFAVVQLTLRIGSSIVDGFQSAGCVAGEAGFGHLRWPLVGSYLGYDTVWGFHWFGWPWLRSMFLPLLPWKPEHEIVVLSLLWLVGVMGVKVGITRKAGSWAGWAGACFTLLAPGYLTALQSYRPEIPTAVALVWVVVLWFSESRGGRTIRAILLVCLPLLHPLGLVVPAAWWCLSTGLKWRQVGGAAALRSMWGSGGFLCLGGILFCAWYASQPLALNQFMLNVRSQRLLVDGLGTGYGTLFYWGFGSLSSIPLALFVIPASICGLMMTGIAIRRSVPCDRDGSILVGFGVGIAFLFNWLTRNPNPLHFVAILPLACWEIVVLLCKWQAVPRVTASCVLFCAAIAFPAKQGWQLLQKDGASYRNSLEGILGGLPSTRRVLIPICLWEAAVGEHSAGPEYRFSTFPNILPRDQRAEYEREVVAGTQPGDLLIWDSLQEEGGVFNFVQETALRHQIIHPLEDPSHWVPLGEIKVPTTYSRGQTPALLLFQKR